MSAERKISMKCKLCGVTNEIVSADLSAVAMLARVSVAHDLLSPACSKRYAEAAE